MAEGMVEDQVRSLDQSIREMEHSIMILDMEEKATKLQFEIQKRKRSLAELQQDFQRQLDTTPQPSSLRPSSSQHHSPQPRMQTGMPTLVSGSTRMDLDPQVYLMKTCDVKYKPICDFIPRAATIIEEEVDMGNGVFIKWKSGAKPKLETITPAQWIVANARILGELIRDCDPAVDVVTLTLDYLSYTAKIGEYGTIFTWASVVLLDDEYRRHQSQFQFRWVSDSPHVSHIMLREREVAKKQTGNKKSMKSKPFCFDYNNGKICKYGKECDFKHLCEICEGDHSKVNHPDDGVKK